MLESQAQGKTMAKSLDPAHKPVVLLEQLSRSEKFKLATPIIRMFCMHFMPGQAYKFYKGFQYWTPNDWEVFKKVTQEIFEIRMRDKKLDNPARDEKIILEE
tara:strand:+ start:242 stop:547 length:306 start_codon:yes stop_codon:yes gene_type:complete